MPRVATMRGSPIRPRVPAFPPQRGETRLDMVTVDLDVCVVPPPAARDNFDEDALGHFDHDTIVVDVSTLWPLS
jgi:hypothetical protein